MANDLSERPHLLALPLELTINIWEHLDKKSLKSLRSTSKTCQRYSTQPLFRSFTLYPHVRSFERLIYLSEQPHIARHVQEIHFNTILLGLTEIINRRLASVYSAQINDAERKAVAEHARQLHNQNLRADAPFDELAQLSYLERILPGLPNLRIFIVVDATGLQKPSHQFMDALPSFYQELVDETCGRFEHTRLERGMFGTPLCRGGSYSRAVIMALHKAPRPIETLVLRGIRWAALLSSTDFTKNKLLVDGVFSKIKHFELIQSHSSLFPGPLCLISLQRILSHMVNLEWLELVFRENHEIYIKGRGTELRDLVNGVRCQSYFSGFGLDIVGGPLPAKLNWSPALRHLMLIGMVCSAQEMKSILRNCASSLKTLVLADLVLTPDVLDGPRSCLVSLFKWMQSRLDLEHIELFGTLTNGGMQHWIVDPTRTNEETDFISAQVHRFILKGGSCPLDHVAIPPDYYDVGKRVYTGELPDCFDTEVFAGDASWLMEYEEEEEEWEDESDWSEDDPLNDLMFDAPDLEDDMGDGEPF